MPDDEKYGSPKIIEMLKDGKLQSEKYCPIQVSFDNCQTAIMCNKELDWCALGEDRWEVYEADYAGALDEKFKPIPEKISLFKWSDEVMAEKYALSEAAKNKDKSKDAQWILIEKKTETQYETPKTHFVPMYNGSENEKTKSPPCVSLAPKRNSFSVGEKISLKNGRFDVPLDGQ